MLKKGPNYSDNFFNTKVVNLSFILYFKPIAKDLWILHFYYFGLYYAVCYFARPFDDFYNYF